MTAPAARRVSEVLVATDFSASASAALRVAGEYAAQLGARLHVLHVVGGGDDVAALLARAVEALPPGAPVVTATASGDAAEAIVRYARDHAVDLVVVGTHGRTGVSRALLGSVAERVARTAPCPVLTVPPTAERPAPPAEEPVARGLGRCLVCAKPSPDLICEPCRARIRGEALERKQRQERAGRI